MCEGNGQLQNLESLAHVHIHKFAASIPSSSSRCTYPQCQVSGQSLETLIRWHCMMQHSIYSCNLQCEYCMYIHMSTLEHWSMVCTQIQGACKPMVPIISLYTIIRYVQYILQKQFEHWLIQPQCQVLEPDSTHVPNLTISIFTDTISLHLCHSMV